MAQPTPYAQAFDFSDFSTDFPSSQQPGVRLDAEFSAVALTFSQTLANLALIQRDDGQLKNASVRLATLHSEVIAALALEGVTVLTWATATAYTLGQVVINGDDVYLVAIAHTSGVLATDVTAAKLILIFDSGISTALAASGGSALVGQIAAGIGAIARTVQAKLRDEGISVKDFGALGTGAAADDRAAILLAHTAAVTQLKPLIFPPTSAGYGISLGVAFSHLIDVIMEDSYLLYTGSAQEAALTIGAAANFTYGRRYDLQVKRQTQSTWSDEANIGIRMFNIDHADLLIVRGAENFTIGVQMRGDTAGCSYNNVVLGLLNNNKVGLDLTNLGGGWCNENVYIGGRFSCDTGVNATLARFGVRIRTEGSYVNNSLTFVKPSLEKNRSGSGEAVGMLISAGAQIRVIEARDESNDVFIRTEGDSENIHASTSYTDSGSFTPVVQDNGRYCSIFVSSGRSAAIGRGPASWQSPAGWEAHQYDATNWAVAGLGAGAVSGALFAKTTTLLPKPDYLQIPTDRIVGRELDTRVTKLVKVARSVDSTFKGRFYVRCMDEKGNNIPGADTVRANSTAYVVGNLRYISGVAGVYLECTTSGTTAAAPPTFTHTAGATATDGTCVWTIRQNPVRADLGELTNPYGTAFFSEGSDNDAPLTLGFRSDVKRAHICIGGGTDVCRLKGGFSIQSMDGTPILTTHPVRGQRDVRTVAAAPVEGGYYGESEYLFRFPAASAASIGWGVATAGWASATIWLLSTAYAVGDVRYNGTNVYVVDVAGTSAGAGGPSGTGLAIVDNTVTWRYVAARAVFVAGPNAP